MDWPLEAKCCITSLQLVPSVILALHNTCGDALPTHRLFRAPVIHNTVHCCYWTPPHLSRSQPRLLLPDRQRLRNVIHGRMMRRPPARACSLSSSLLSISMAPRASPNLPPASRARPITQQECTLAARPPAPASKLPSFRGEGHERRCRAVAAEDEMLDDGLRRPVDADHINLSPVQCSCEQLISPTWSYLHKSLKTMCDVLFWTHSCPKRCESASALMALPDLWHQCGHDNQGPTTQNSWCVPWLPLCSSLEGIGLDSSRLPWILHLWRWVGMHLSCCGFAHGY